MRERNEFHQHLFRALSPYDYALIDFGSGAIYDLGNHKSIDILLKKKNLESTIKALRQFDGIAHMKLSSRYSLSKMNIHFKDQTVLQINFVHKFIQDLTIYLDEKEFLAKRVLMNNGVFVCSLDASFEYMALSAILREREIPTNQFLHFNDYHILVQDDLLEYLNLKYALNLKELFDLNFDQKKNKASILKSIKGQFPTPFVSNINIRWHKFFRVMKQARII